MDSGLVLRTENLSKVYNGGYVRVAALKSVNISIRKGEFVTIIGPSGSGKSTLLHLLGALDRPTSGKVYVDGIDIYSYGDSELAMIRNRKIGFIFQAFNLINRTTVLRNVEMPAIIAGIPSDVRVAKAMQLLRMLGIEDKANFKPISLSGGQQQRVAIARALINDPAVILADEPTGNLDSKTGLEVIELLSTLCTKYHKTVVMVTHNLEHASMSTRSIYIRDGMIEKEVVYQ
ncbi:MAG: ABC transporter ATP-binding protein [Candidatus Nitrosocaldus sp.]|nr:ABC transporter ATP-binding protein [Candidatus Nitrosocaldus sp.]MCS7141203.1 ABC transporter ATP-binding protein [Candidatus Nitrosocaldus sp.]MDW8000191.1 ABC transporter ATP-binding protein [Candidatus Nitrosocaldus sp.]MDW8275646.1 ABC transporter ATP-binding protein [Candidatus Nitrosocaldus sp.]